MRKQWLVLLIAVMASVTLWGCGSSGSGGSEVTDPAEIGDATDTGNCTICHTTQVHTEISGIAGAHPDYPAAVTASNYLGVAITHDCEDCHGGGQFHHGVGPIPYPSPDLERCATCHDQATKVLASVHNGNDVENASALVPGDEHYVDGVCMTCHTAEGFIALKSIVGTETDFDDGFDAATNVPESFDAEDNSIVHNPVCGSCHNPLTKEMNTADAGWTPNGSSSAQLALCTSCHGYKLNDGTLMTTGGTYSVSTDAGADEEWFTDDDTLSAGTDTDVIGHHDTSWYRTIATTHFDNPDSTGVVEGYVIREDSDTPCFDCHGHELRTNTRHHRDNDPTEADAVETIYTEWASSVHAGNLLVAKEAAADANPVTLSRGDAGYSDQGIAQVEAVLSVGATEDTGAAWVHYNWDAENRADCQMCHTATGAMNFLNNPDDYNDAMAAYKASSDTADLPNDFSHLADWTAATGSPQNELLYCWGCHSNAESGQLRNPGATTRPYAVGDVDVTMPDVGNSNVCINCHGARGNVESYALTADPATDGDVNDPATDMSALKPGFGPGTKNVTNAHYLVASATLYAADSKVGYEYLGQDYAPVPYFEHGSIGLNADSPETGAGPCVACHMETSESHTYEVVTKSDMGVITALNSTACIECHTGGHGAGLVVEDTTTENGLQTATAAAAFLEEEAEGYHEALEMLNQALVAKGLTFSGNYPYFSGDSWIDEGTFGAAHNYNYLHHEPGAYAHNRFYAKRLIFDSLDWLDNGVLDGTITIDAATYPEADAWLASGASRP